MMGQLANEPGMTMTMNIKLAIRLDMYREIMTWMLAVEGVEADYVLFLPLVGKWVHTNFKEDDMLLDLVVDGLIEKGFTAHRFAATNGFEQGAFARAERVGRDLRQHLHTDKVPELVALLLEIQTIWLERT